MRIDNFLKKLSIEELIEVRTKSSNLISSHKDGYFYICECRSYGRNWKDNFIANIYNLQDLCHQYYGDDGIVDVYSNNPHLSKLDNYGSVMFIPTEEDYTKWKKYISLKNSISSLEAELFNWDGRDKLPYRERPNSQPLYTQKDLDEMKLEFENFDMNFIKPLHVKRDYDEFGGE